MSVVAGLVGLVGRALETVTRDLLRGMPPWSQTSPIRSGGWLVEHPDVQPSIAGRAADGEGQRERLGRLADEGAARVVGLLGQRSRRLQPDAESVLLAERDQQRRMDGVEAV